MKKLSTIFIVIVMLFTCSFVMAQGADFDVRLGANYPDAPDQFGFDSQFSLHFTVNQYLAAGVDSGFGWIRWKEYTGEQRDEGSVGTYETKLTDAFSFPLLFSVRLGLSHMRSNGFEPYITAGAGYSWTLFQHPDDEATYGGFTWQIMGGAAIVLPDTNMDIVVELGYRGAALYDEHDYELDMSGLVAHAGVRFKLGGVSNSDDFE